MKPEQVRAKVRKVEEVFKQKFDEVEEKKNALDIKSDTLFQKYNEKLSKIRESCRHEFEYLSNDRKNLVCLCGEKKPVKEGKDE